MRYAISMCLLPKKFYEVTRKFYALTQSSELFVILVPVIWCVGSVLLASVMAAVSALFTVLNGGGVVFTAVLESFVWPSVLVVGVCLAAMYVTGKRH